MAAVGTALVLSPLVGQNDTTLVKLEQLDGRLAPRALLDTVTFEQGEITFEEALDFLVTVGKIDLSFNRSRLPLEQKVSLHTGKVTTVEALFSILDQTATELVVTNGSHLVIVPAISRPGSVEGLVTDMETGEPLQRANVVLAGTYLGAATDQAGRFNIKHVQPGKYTVQAMMMGYKPRQITEVVYEGYSPVDVTIELEPTVIYLSEVVITPGHFSLMEEIPTTRHALRAEDIRSFPQLGEDIYRAVSRLPGLASNDFAAGFYIRGGQQNEVLVLLDGMELYNPFHLKMIDGLMSFIDVEGIRGIEMITGAFPAEYGNRLSGVFNLKTISPLPYRKRTSLAISFLNARLLTERSFAKERGQWMLLVRRGYIDLLMKVAGQEMDPPLYYDILSKIQYNVSPRHSLSAHILIAHDQWASFIDNADVDTRSDNGYGWLTWYSQWSSSLNSRTLISSGGYEDLSDMVEVESDFRESSLIFMDQRYMHFYGLKQDWTWQLSENYLLKWGFDARDFRSQINYYHRNRKVLGQIDTYFTSGYNLASRYSLRDGVEYSGYLSQRMRPIEPVAIEMGLRYESSTWTGDRHWSPRFSMVYNLADHTSIRGGWGYYYQTQSLTQGLGLYGDPEFYPAERAEHRVIGIEHEFPGGVQLRIEGYQKVLTSLRPHYITWQESTLRPHPLVDSDHIKLEPEGGEAIGVEFYLRRETGHRLSYWLSYSLSKARNKVDGRWLPRYYDQRHTFYCDLSWKPNHKYRLNLHLQYHTGWPYTAVQVVDLHETSPGFWSWQWGPGPLYGERFPDYRRIDFRVNRIFYTKYGRVTGFFEIRNLLNHDNPRKYLFYGSPTPKGDGSDEVEVEVGQYESDGWLPLLPSFGIIWDL